MVQVLNDPYKGGSANIFGRIGQQVGQGLAEQIPKEVDRYRLSQGLQQFAQDSANLDPMQQLAQLSSIPGVTPQMIQSFGELAKQQSAKNAFRNRANRLTQQSQEGAVSKPLEDIRFANLPETKAGVQKGLSPEQRQDNFGQPQIVDTNPLRQEAIPRKPWTPERKDQEIDRIFQEFPNLTIPEAQAMANDREQRELSQPLAEQEKDEYLRKIQDIVDNKFIKQLEKKLQKTGKGVFKDITGENLINLQRGLSKELKENPRASVDDVVNKWTSKAAEFAKAKSDIKDFSNRNIIDKVFKPTENLNKLKSYQKIYRDANNLEEFYNLLRTKRSEGVDGFDMSPQVASQIAYPRSKKVSEYLKNQPRINIRQAKGQSAKIAKDIIEILSDEDSILAIMQDLRDKEINFNQSEFLNYIRENQDDLRLSSRQKRELGKGEGDFFPDWGDFWLPGGKYEWY